MRAVFYERKVLYMKFGYFDDANREYVITTPRTPYPWINYLGTQGFFSLISNTAGGYSFYKVLEESLVTVTTTYLLIWVAVTSILTRMAPSGIQAGLQ